MQSLLGWKGTVSSFPAPPYESHSVQELGLLNTDLWPDWEAWLSNNSPDEGLSCVWISPVSLLLGSVSCDLETVTSLTPCLPISCITCLFWSNKWVKTTGRSSHLMKFISLPHGETNGKSSSYRPLWFSLTRLKKNSRNFLSAKTDGRVFTVIPIIKITKSKMYSSLTKPDSHM